MSCVLVPFLCLAPRHSIYPMFRVLRFNDPGCSREAILRGCFGERERERALKKWGNLVVGAGKPEPHTASCMSSFFSPFFIFFFFFWTLDFLGALFLCCSDTIFGATDRHTRGEANSLIDWGLTSLFGCWLADLARLWSYRVSFFFFLIPSSLILLKAVFISG